MFDPSSDFFATPAAVPNPCLTARLVGELGPADALALNPPNSLSDELTDAPNLDDVEEFMVPLLEVRGREEGG